MLRERLPIRGLRQVSLGPSKPVQDHIGSEVRAVDDVAVESGLGSGGARPREVLSMIRSWMSVLAMAAATATSCAHEDEPPDHEERTRKAAAAYSVEAFDTVSWADDSVRALAGNEVYASRCRICHGRLGMGDSEYARERGLEVPSLVDPSWPLASLDSVRRRIFVGSGGGAPHFGVAGLTLREIDSSAFYILYSLRPEVLRGAHPYVRR